MLTRSVSMIGVYALSIACTSSHAGTPVIPLDSGAGGLTPLPLPTGGGGTGGNGTGGHGGATDASTSDAHTPTEGGAGLDGSHVVRDGSLRDSGSTGGGPSADATPAAIEPCATVGAQRCGANDVEICVGSPSVWTAEGCNFGCEAKDANQPSCLCTARSGRYVVTGAGPYRQVVDSVTGLTWGSDEASGTVADAVAACAGGWRLPSAAEIQLTLVQRAAGPASAGCSETFDPTLYPSVPVSPASPADATFWISDILVNRCGWDLFGGVICPANPAQVFRYRCVK